jgi:hypothetical protein
MKPYVSRSWTGRSWMRPIILFHLCVIWVCGPLYSAPPSEIPEEPSVEEVELPDEEPPATDAEPIPEVEPGDPPPTPFSYFDGISTRALIDNVNYVNPENSQNFGIINTSMIVEGGSGLTQTVVWRGRGPSINLDVPLASNPFLDVVKIGEGPLVTNDRYADDANYSLIEGTSLVPDGIEEEETIATTPDLSPNAYSVRVTSNSDTQGIAIGEGFAFFSSEPEEEPGVKLTGISTRAPVGNGANQVMNASFIVKGEEPVDVVCRGRGPSINLPDSISKLPDPYIDLVRLGEGVIASNDNWEDGDNLNFIVGTSFIPNGIESTEAIIVALGLPPGAYSLRLRDSGNTEPGTGGEGIGIAEVFLADFDE